MVSSSNPHKYQPDSEHILVCLSSSPSNERIIRCAAEMYRSFGGVFTALFVETPSFSSMKPADRQRLFDHMELAKSLGAHIEKVTGEDISYQIAEFARLSRVTKIIIGSSAMKKGLRFWKASLTDRLIYYAPNIEIYIIPDSRSIQKKFGFSKPGPAFRPNLKDFCICVLMLVLATATGLLFSSLGLTDANIITIYILSVLLIALMTTSYIYCLLASFIAVITFNFLFTDPRYTLLAYDAGYPVTFLVMFIVSCITGNLASKLKLSARQSAEAAYRTKILFDTEQLIVKVHGPESVASITAQQIMKLLGCTVVLYLEKQGSLSDPQIFSVSMEETEHLPGEKDTLAAGWVLQNNTHAGAGTGHYPDALYSYYAIRMNQTVYGVIGIDMQGSDMDSLEKSIFLSILGECALALENDRNAQEKEEASIQAHNEQIRANLLRSISHDLRTPLTTISGNVSNLLYQGNMFDEHTKRQLYADIYDESVWLNNLVENILSISRIENGTMNLHMSTELLEECIQEAILHLDRNSDRYNISVHFPDEVILVRIEARLIVQVLINLLNNAVKYTPPGSDITINVTRENTFVSVEVSDNGPGISPEDREHIFDMFYTSRNQAADSHRSMGLGLSLCQSIITAHGGQIFVRDHLPRGTTFLFTLPVMEVNINE